ncbi:hypothetical protein JTE90_000256 [Oedothorax gibbosus]|uniref:Uncharacterized protein n=1 Tax=Oedothorax gibbosus TaxID=931172 RepID=A0AAV6VRU5_9ARAC|nr:hypothetical protein JTE90_000256 [Oedothorax gibbosus]
MPNVTKHNSFPLSSLGLLNLVPFDSKNPFSQVDFYALGPLTHSTIGLVSKGFRSHKEGLLKNARTMLYRSGWLPACDCLVTRYPIKTYLTSTKLHVSNPKHPPTSTNPSPIQLRVASNYLQVQKKSKEKKNQKTPNDPYHKKGCQTIMKRYEE